MVTDRQYTPQPVPEWRDIIAAKDAEIAELRAKLNRLVDEAVENYRRQHVDMGRS